MSIQNRLAKEDQFVRLALELSTLINDRESLYRTRLDRLEQLARLGQWEESNALWQKLSRMGNTCAREVCRPGDAQLLYAQSSFWQGTLQFSQLKDLETIAREANNRWALRSVHRLHGMLLQCQQRWGDSIEYLHEAVGMAREISCNDALAETRFALAKFHCNQLTSPRREAGRLAMSNDPANFALAELWLAIGDRELAEKHALAAYQWAWADGEPFVHRYELNKSRALLEQLGAEIPNLPPYDPAKDEKLPWEDAVVAAIEELRTEKAAETTRKKEPEKTSNPETP